MFRQTHTARPFSQNHSSIRPGPLFEPGAYTNNPEQISGSKESGNLRLVMWIESDPAQTCIHGIMVIHRRLFNGEPGAPHRRRVAVQAFGRVGPYLDT